MLIDRSHAGWGVVTGAAVAAATGAYVWSRGLPGGAGGGSAVGLALGLAALAAMLYALVLGVRKALVRRFSLFGIGFVPRLGSIEWWTKGHIWLGLAALPLALLHSGFRASGSLAIVLVVLLVSVVVTGIYGLVLQHFLPHELATRERGQTTHEESERRTWNFVSDGHASVKKTCDDALKAAREAQVVYRVGAPARAAQTAALPEAERPAREKREIELEQAYTRAITDAQDVRARLERTRDRLDAARPDMPLKKPTAAPVPGRAKLSRASVGTRMVEMPKGPLPTELPDPSALVAPSELVAFYDEIALPYLLSPLADSVLGDGLGSETVFDSVRQRIPEAHRAALAELRVSCDAVRRKARMRGIFRLLHGWLLVHVPLAVLLVVLTLIHAVMAVRF